MQLVPLRRLWLKLIKILQDNILKSKKKRGSAEYGTGGVYGAPGSDGDSRPGFRKSKIKSDAGIPIISLHVLRRFA